MGWDFFPILVERILVVGGGCSVRVKGILMFGRNADFELDNSTNLRIPFILALLLKKKEYI